MENRNKINVKTGEKHFDIPKSEAIDLRARRVEKEEQYNNRDTASDNRSDDREYEVNEEKNIEKKPARENMFKSFLKKHKPASGRDSARGIESRDPSPAAQDDRENIHSTQDDNDKNQGDQSKIGETFDKAIIALLYLLVFALPLFILPFSMEIYEFNKVLLLFFISSLAFLLWVAKMILIDKRLAFIRTPLDMPIIVFISLVLVSTAFSVDKISSILGFYGRFSDSLLVYLSLAMLYFVVVNVVTHSVIARSSAERRGNLDVNGNNRNSMANDDSNGIASVASLPRNDSDNLIKAFIVSSFIIVIAGLFYFFGFKFIPWQETQFRSFNLTSGSLNVFGIYLTAVILIALSYRGQAANVLSRNLMSALIIISLVLLTIIDFIIVWIVLAVSLLLALLLTFVTRSKTDDRGNSIVASTLIILISLVFTATSLTFINKDVKSNFSSSLISTSIKNRIVSSDNNLVANNDGFNREVILDKGTAVSVAIEGTKQDPIAGIIGSGPGTYLYNFSKFKPAEFNNNLFWNIRFDKAGSEILEKASTIGILGALSYLLIAVFVMGMFLKNIVIARSPAGRRGNPEVGSDDRNNMSNDDSHGIASVAPLPRNDSNIYLFAAWFALLLFQFLYLEATTTKFIFWLLTAILVTEYCGVIARSSAERRSNPETTSEELNNGIASVAPLSRNDSGIFTLDLKKEKSSFYSSLLVLVILILSFSSAYYYQIKFYQAEAGYKNVVLRQNEALAKSGLSAEQIWDVLNKNTDELKEIIAKNPHRGTYKVYLSDIYLNRMNLVFQEESQKDESERNNQRIAEEAKNTIDYAKSAADTNPNNIIFQHKIADVYMTASRDIGIVGADEWAVKKYRKAIELEPTNPVLHASFGKIYALYYSVTKSEESINQAISEFEKALELKDDYLEAGLQLGIAYENIGDNQKAISVLNSFGSIQRIESVISVGQIVTSQSVDIDIVFQLGRLYYNADRISKAKDIFRKIVKVSPNNSNARYSLGLIYEREENYKNALSEFEAVLLANPENEDVKSKIEKLEKIVNREVKPIPIPETEPEEESESESESETESETEEIEEE